MKIWMQFNVMPLTSLGVDAIKRHAQDRGTVRLMTVFEILELINFCMGSYRLEGSCRLLIELPSLIATEY